MRKTTLALAAVLAAFVTFFSTTAAQAYPDPVIEVTGGETDGVVAPGEEFTVAGDFGGTDCQPWEAVFEGQGVDGSGTTFSVTFTAPTEPGEYAITIVCTYEDTAGAASSVSTGFIPLAAESTLTIPITVEGDAVGGDDSDDAGAADGALPDTGGSNLLLVAGGAALVVLGAGLVVARRRA